MTTCEAIAACLILGLLLLGVVWFVASAKTFVNDARDVGGWKC